MQKTIIVQQLSDLQGAAKELLAFCDGKKVFAFEGNMGAGKTTFIKSICEALGVRDTISSPTFSIVNEYHFGTNGKVFHFDFYRIKSIEEAYDMGYEDYFYSNAFCFIEWPEKVKDILPTDVVRVQITIENEDRRKINITTA